MLLIIHNLPSNTNYAKVKALIEDKCGLTELIVDNLVAEGNGKKVTVGLASEGDAALLVRNIGGMYMGNRQLYVEDVRKKKATEQSFRPNPISNQFVQGQFNQGPETQFGDGFYRQQEAMQFQSTVNNMSMEAQVPSNEPAPNFGVPFYMTAQNQNVGNNPNFMIEYPKVRGSTGNESYEGRDIGFEQQFGARKGESRSREREENREQWPGRSSRWTDPDHVRSDVSRGRDRSVNRDDHHDGGRSYKDNSYRNSYQSRSSNQDSNRSNKQSNRFDKPSNRSEQIWERRDRASLGESSASFNFKNSQNANVQDRRYNEERESQRFKDVNNPQSRGSQNASRGGGSSKKRPYESTDKNKFVPQTKKFGSNRQFHMQSKPQMQSHGLQKNKPPWQPKKPEFSKNQPMKNDKKHANFTKDRLAPTVSNKSDTTPTKEMIARHEAWRVQAASVISTEILNKLGLMRHKRDPVLVKLKACVRARIDVLAGTGMSFNINDMLASYRDTFCDHDAFYNAVLAKVENEEDEQISVKVPEHKSGEVVNKDSADKIETPELKSLPADTQRLPKYPDGNKNMLKQMKKAQKDEALNDSAYVLDAEHDTALNEELDKFEGIIKKELENPENATESTMSKFMNDVFLPDVRKVLTLHVKKRILDIRTNLAVRVICHYKAPIRDALDAFLKDYGVVSLKASDKKKNMLVAICDSYENYDALCKLGSTVIDTLRVMFKPFQITGPPVKGKNKNQATRMNKKKVDNVPKPESKSADHVQMNDENETQSAEINSEKDAIKGVNDVQEAKVNGDNECEIIQANKSQGDIVIEDNVPTSKDVIESDEKDTVMEKEVIAIDEAQSVPAESESLTNDDIATPNNKELLTGGDNEIKIDDNETVVTNDNEAKEHQVCEVIENDNIVEDDLEDF